MKPLLCLFLLAGAAAEAAPRTAPSQSPVVPAEVPPQIEMLQPGVKITLLAEHPDLVTPTGIAVDKNGNIYSISCHTHFRPEDYDGPEHDEVLVFDANGKNRRVFYNKTDATMHVEIGPDGWIYLAERDRVLRVKDSNGDGVGDVEENLATLDTVADYPHNGLSGMAWHPDGGLVFSLGENFGKDWTLTGKDGSKVSGRGEGGVFRCAADGSKLRRIALGFWNPFGLLVRKDGEIFAAENDPGSRPPCRLLNVVEGADYGFQWVYGSAPVHPFVGMNGELRGTIGMVHPCGEGPCAIVELGGGVLIPSWSDHSLDYYPLSRKGAGYDSRRIPLLKGGDFFRPTCMAAGLDGAFYLNDWVFSSYPIHKRGRLWKVEIDPAKAGWIKAAEDPLNEQARLADGLRTGRNKMDVKRLLELAKGKDAYLADAALTAMAREKWTVAELQKLAPADRVWAFVALRRVDLKEEKWVKAFLSDPDPEMRFECLRWIADGVLTQFTPQVEALLSDSSLDYRLFEAVLAAWNTLRGDPGAGVTNAEVLVERILNAKTPARLKGYALRLAPPAHKQLTVQVLRELFAAGDPALSLEVVRTLAARNADDSRAVLAEIVADETQKDEIRADAIAGLASSTKAGELDLLVKLAAGNDGLLRSEAQRALRFTDKDKTFVMSASRPVFNDTAAWLKLLDGLPGKANPETGRRIFFHSKVGLCATCHRHSGRGNVVGPDLSLVFQQGDRAAILSSILEPGREVAPQYHPSQVKLKDGTEFIGIMLRSSSTEVFRDIAGKERTFPQTDIVKRTEIDTSLMPQGLVMSLTNEELRDLLAFLTSAH